MCANRDVFPRAVPALSLAAFLCSAAAVANAAGSASADALLSNLDEDNDVGFVVGTPAGAPRVRAAQAIRFQTGSNERGYNLTSVKVVLADASDSDGVRLRIFNSRSNGNPYYSLYTLTNPTVSDGTLTFTLPASATVQKDTRYFVLFDSTVSGTGNDYEIRGTESDSLNSMADSWSLNTDRHVGAPDSLFWSTYDEGSAGRDQRRCLGAGQRREPERPFDRRREQQNPHRILPALRSVNDLLHLRRSHLDRPDHHRCNSRQRGWRRGGLPRRR